MTRRDGQQRCCVVRVSALPAAARTSGLEPWDEVDVEAPGTAPVAAERAELDDLLSPSTPGYVVVAIDVTSVWSWRPTATVSMPSPRWSHDPPPSRTTASASSPRSRRTWWPPCLTSCAPLSPRSVASSSCCSTPRQNSPRARCACSRPSNATPSNSSGRPTTCWRIRGPDGA